MLTFLNILKLYDNIDTTRIKLVRHSNAEIPILDTFQNNRVKFETYQSYQSPNKFSKADYIAVFAPQRNTFAVFLGIWNIKSYTENDNLTEEQHLKIDKYEFPNDWHNIVSYYELDYNFTFEELSQRLVIDWGKGVLAWVQAQDKPIIEIKGKNSLGDLPTFDKVILSYQDLKTLVFNPDSNAAWINSLSSVKGIYLIRHKKSGKLYVGSASGGEGIFGRWKDYALSGDGGNVGLKNLDSNNFEFSILEIASNTISQTEIIHKENLWKQKLGTWKSLNSPEIQRHNNNVV